MWRQLNVSIAMVYTTTVSPFPDHLTESRTSVRDSPQPSTKESSKKSQKDETNALGVLKGHQSEVRLS